MNEKCEACGTAIEEGTGNEWKDNNCKYKYLLCDKCIEKADSINKINIGGNK